MLPQPGAKTGRSIKKGGGVFTALPSCPARAHKGTQTTNHAKEIFDLTEGYRYITLGSRVLSRFPLVIPELKEGMSW
jgi:hypothetical protein